MRLLGMLVTQDGAACKPPYDPHRQAHAIKNISEPFDSPSQLATRKREPQARHPNISAPQLANKKAAITRLSDKSRLDVKTLWGSEDVAIIILSRHMG
eukprot:gene607-2033_t